MKRLFEKFLNDREGNIAIMTAILIPVLLAFVALAVDTTNFYKQKRDLSDAADAALVFGAKQYEVMRSQGRTKDQSERGAKRVASQAFFNQNKESYGRVRKELSYQEVDGKIIGEITYTYNSPFYFQGFVSNKKRQPISNTSKIVLGGGSDEAYIDLTLVLDNSASMGVGASPQDQRTMHLATGCTFACHVPRSTSELANLPDVARAAGAELRFDVMKEAAIEALRALDSQTSGTDKVRVSVYTFSNYFQTLTDPTTNMNEAIRDIQRLDFADDTNTPENVFAGTNLDYAMEQLDQTLSTRQNRDRRRNEVDRESYVVLFTDGIENDTYQRYDNEELYSNENVGPNGDAVRDFLIRAGQQGSFPQYFETIPGSKKYTLVIGDPNWVNQSDRVDYTQVFDPNICNPIKEDGHTIIAIQTFYDVTSQLKSHSFSRAPGQFIEDREDQIANKFKSCASGEANYHLTQDADDMTQTFKDALLSTLGEEELRLTQ